MLAAKASCVSENLCDVCLHLLHLHLFGCSTFLFCFFLLNFPVFFFHVPVFPLCPPLHCVSLLIYDIYVSVLCSSRYVHHGNLIQLFLGLCYPSLVHKVLCSLGLSGCPSVFLWWDHVLLSFSPIAVFTDCCASDISCPVSYFSSIVVIPLLVTCETSCFFFLFFFVCLDFILLVTDTVVLVFFELLCSVCSLVSLKVPSVILSAESSSLEICIHCS